jgi:hypothetical protein
MINACILLESLKSRDHPPDPDVDGRIILKQNLKKGEKGKESTGFIWLRTGTSGGCCKQENGHPVS